MKRILAMSVAAGLLLAGGRARATLYSQTFNSGGSVGSVAGGNYTPTLFTGTFNNDPNSLDTVVLITVGLNITGGYSGGFYLALTGPDGNTTTVLLNQPGTTTSGLNLTFADNGGGTITPSSDLSNGGTYTPSAPLSGLNGQTAYNGTWTLAFADTSSGDGGATLNSWTLSMDVVPEPVNVALAVFGGLAGLGLCVGALRKRLAKAAQPQE